MTETVPDDDNDDGDDDDCDANPGRSQSAGNAPDGCPEGLAGLNYDQSCDLACSSSEVSVISKCSGVTAT